MQRITSQFKSVASLLLTATAGIASGVACARYFAQPPKPGWQIPAILFAVCLLVQLALIFVDSAEDVELSSFRAQRDELIAAEHARRLELTQQQIRQNRLLAAEKLKSIQAGEFSRVESLEDLKRKSDG